MFEVEIWKHSIHRVFVANFSAERNPVWDIRSSEHWTRYLASFYELESFVQSEIKCVFCSQHFRVAFNAVVPIDDCS